MELEDVDGRTKMVTTHSGVAQNSPGVAGWTMAFDKLDTYAKSPSRGLTSSGLLRTIHIHIHIDAEVAAVYELLTDADQFVRWMAPTATLDPRPGGVISWEHVNGDVVSGTYVELIPHRRVVFTYGWERGDVGVPPGSTVVEIDLRPTDGGTELHLVHRGLPGPMADADGTLPGARMIEIAAVGAASSQEHDSSPAGGRTSRSCRRWIDGQRGPPYMSRNSSEPDAHGAASAAR